MKIFKLVLLFIFGLVLASPLYAQNSPQTETALSYGLVIDNSNSLKAIMKQIKQASKNVIAGNKATDETFVIRFVSSDVIEKVSNFTQDTVELNKTIDKLAVEGGRTAIIDALYVSAKYLLQNSRKDNNRRRVLVLMTDGEDRENYYKMEQLLELLKREKIVVYVIGFPNEAKELRGNKAFKKATKFINTITTETGGRAFLSERKEQIEETANGFLDKIRQQ